MNALRPILTLNLAGIWLVPSISLLLFVCYAVYNICFHPLRHVPGPLTARVCSLHLLATFLRGEQHIEQIQLHNRYGSIVRVAPNLVIINDPAYFSLYFNWAKATFWRAFRAHPTHITHANELDVEPHKAKKKLVMPAYQMSTVIKNELRIDRHISTLTRQLRERTGKVIDFSPWTQYAAFDIVMDMVFSNPPGFLENAKDINGLIASIHELLTAAMIPAMFPFLSKMMYHPWLFPYIAPKPIDPTGPGHIHGLAYEQVRIRFKSLQDSATRFADVLQGIIDKPGNENMPLEMLEQESVNPILAGSDSVGAHIRAAVLHVATTPRVLAKLQSEIDAADKQGLLGEIPQFDQVRKYVPYVDLVHKEAMRMYPIVGGALPREVPKGGATVCGHFLPEGTDVGVSQWAVSRNPKIWGDDFDVFRPERWENPTAAPDPGKKNTEGDEAVKHDDAENYDIHSHQDTTTTEAARKLRDSGNIFFSSGPMMCTGRHIAQLEIFKIITQLFRVFDIQVVNPVRPWKEANKFGMLQWDFWVKVTERRGGVHGKEKTEEESAQLTDKRVVGLEL